MLFFGVDCSKHSKPPIQIICADVRQLQLRLERCWQPRKLPSAKPLVSGGDVRQFGNGAMALDMRCSVTSNGRRGGVIHPEGGNVHRHRLSTALLLGVNVCATPIASDCLLCSIEVAQLK